MSRGLKQARILRLVSLCGLWACVSSKSPAGDGDAGTTADASDASPAGDGGLTDAANDAGTTADASDGSPAGDGGLTDAANDAGTAADASDASGASPTVVATLGGFPESLALDGNVLYATIRESGAGHDGMIQSVPKTASSASVDAGIVTTLASGLTAARAIAVHSGAICGPTRSWPFRVIPA